MDDNTEVYVADKMQPHLAKLKAPLGVYATLGNHDFLGLKKRLQKKLPTPVLLFYGIKRSKLTENLPLLGVMMI